MKLLPEHGLRVVVSPHPPLFHDDGPLRLEVLLAEDEVVVPVRFERYRDGYPVGAHILEIGRVIMRSEGVIVAPVLRDDAGELFGSVFSVPLNIMCSSMWERPVFPNTSFLDPTLYHTWNVTRGDLMVLCE